MLNLYLLQTQQLLQNPPAPVSLYATSDLTSWINRARLQVAGDGECVRNYAALALTQGVGVYPFSAIVLNPATGISGVYNIRTAWRVVADGQVWMRPRPFEWFSLYELNNPVPDQGPPEIWSQFGQGVNGSIFVSDVPDTTYTLKLDTVCEPAALADDTTPEIIPYPWTEAVPFFAAYYALLSAQTGARYQDADQMLQRYSQFRDRARAMSTPGVLPTIYPQTPDPTMQNKLGVAPRAPQGRGQ